MTDRLLYAHIEGNDEPQRGLDEPEGVDGPQTPNQWRDTIASVASQARKQAYAEGYQDGLRDGWKRATDSMIDALELGVDKSRRGA